MNDSYAESALVTAEMILHQKILRSYARYVDRFISPSQFLIDLCVKYGWPRRAFVHVPHGITMPTLSQHLGEGDAVVYMGRLSEEKGIDVVLTAAKETPEIPYRIIGDGPEREKIIRRIAEERIQNVTLQGFVSGQKRDDVLAHARILVVPSLWYENAPLSLLEAKAWGKIVLGSRIGGIPELLPAELLVPPGDPQALAHAIQVWYSASLSRREEMGLRLRREVEKEHALETYLARVEGLYRTLTQQ